MKNVALIIPCYNESEDISRKVEILKKYLNDNPIDYSFDIVLVNDGSKDNTEEVINSLKKETRVHALSYTPNKGKGNAVKNGLKYALNELKSDYMIFMDADLSTDLKAIKPCLDILEEGIDIALASRHDKESNIAIKQPFKRRFISKCSRIIISSMFHFKVKDTQCGFKGSNRDIVEIIINKTKMERFSFDVEYLYIAKLNKKTYKSFPVTWSDDRTSTVYPLKSSIRFFKDLFKIKRNKKSYLIK